MNRGISAMRVISSSDTRTLARLLDRPPAADASLERRVAAIVADVRRSGDRALVAYAKRFDGLDGDMEVAPDEIAAAAREVPARVRRAIRDAAGHIRRVARAQVPRPAKVTVRPGVVVELRVTPLARVGCYVPGGRYPLPS